MRLVQRLSRKGLPKNGRLPIAERLLNASMYEPNSGCLLFLSGLDHGGYGLFKGYEMGMLAHRVAYAEWVGPIPEGLDIDHLCRNRACINPAHLEPVTERENTMRSMARSAFNARKVACMRGHPFDEANTYRDRKGGRCCRACQREAVRRYDERKRREQLS